MIETGLYILIGLVILVGVVVAIASRRPDRNRMEYSERIAAPPEAIFPLINDLRAFSTWSPFERKEPNIKSVYSGPESGPGNRHDWDGNREVGAGWCRITNSVPYSRVDMELHMMRPMKCSSDVAFTLVPEGGSTLVTWSVDGPMPLIAKVMDLVIGMERMCGNEFKTGLASLKSRVEGAHGVAA